MRNVEQQPNGQYHITVDEPTVILLCDDTYYYSTVEMSTGFADCGRPVQLFNTVSDAINYIYGAGLILYVEPENAEQ